MTYKMLGGRGRQVVEQRDKGGPSTGSRMRDREKLEDAKEGSGKI